ncbi:MAG: hypothetical protein D6718_11640 [Acidobacteria bacterium]|nr:MAG: hypothetical protein D6718_11640 [Acidobacteriota bacterium]
MRKLALTVLALALVAAGPGLACGKADQAKAAAATGTSFESTAATDVFYGVSGVTPVVTKLPNGVRIAVASNDPATLDKIVKRMGSCPVSSGCSRCPLKAPGVKHTVERTDGGVVITATADSADAVSRLQAYGEAVSARAKSAS